MDCWVKDFCNSFNKERCCKTCIGYQQLKFLYNSSGMPQKYRGEFSINNYEIPNVDAKKYRELKKFKKDIVKNINKGKGIFIHSNNKGNGKTTWVCILMNNYFKEIALENNLRVRGKFINVPMFFQSLKDDFDRKEKEMDSIKRQLKNIDLIIWDDIGAESPNNWVRETLYSYINYRISNDLSQFYTSNLSMEKLKKNLNERIISRIKGQCKLLEFKGADMR